MGCPPVRGDNPRALASGLSYVQVDKHGIKPPRLYVDLAHQVIFHAKVGKGGIMLFTHHSSKMQYKNFKTSMRNRPTMGFACFVSWVTFHTNFSSADFFFKIIFFIMLRGIFQERQPVKLKTRNCVYETLCPQPLACRPSLFTR